MLYTRKYMNIQQEYLAVGKFGEFGESSVIHAKTIQILLKIITLMAESIHLSYIFRHPVLIQLFANMNPAKHSCNTVCNVCVSRSVCLCVCVHVCVCVCVRVCGWLQSCIDTNSII